MSEENIPEIPQETLNIWKNGFNDPSKVLWLKSVSDDDEKKSRNSITYLNAYLTTRKDKKDPRVKRNENGVFFCLQLNPKHHESIKRAKPGHIILISQNLFKDQTSSGKDKTERRFTHLVTPIDDKFVFNPYPKSDPDGWPGRWVKVIAMGSHNMIGSIPLDATDNPNKRRYPFGNSALYSINDYLNKGCSLSEFQDYIFNKFKYCLNDAKWGI